MSILPPIPGIHDLSEQELEIIAVLVSEPWSEDWEARCAGLGRLWFEHGRSRGALVELGLALAEVTGAARGDLVGALVVGYVEGRDAPGQTDTGANLARRSAELAALWRIIQAANSTDSRAAMQVIVDTVTEVMSVDVCSIFLFDTRRNRLILRATKGLSQGAVGVVTIDLGQGPAGLAAQEGQPVVVPDVGSDSRYHVEPRLNEPRSGSAVAVPIILFQQPSKLGRGDQLQGVISIQSLRLRTFMRAEVEFLETVAGDLAFFLANLQRYEQTDERLKRTVRELETLQEVTAAITSTLDLGHVLRQIVQRAGELVSARAAIYEPMLLVIKGRIP